MTGLSISPVFASPDCTPHLGVEALGEDPVSHLTMFFRRESEMPHRPFDALRLVEGEYLLHDSMILDLHSLTNDLFLHSRSHREKVDPKVSLLHETQGNNVCDSDRGRMPVLAI